MAAAIVNVQRSRKENQTFSRQLLKIFWQKLFQDKNYNAINTKESIQVFRRAKAIME